MNSIQVNKEELLYLSALAGVDNLWGVDDPFAGKSETAFRAELLSLQEALVRKGCLDTSVSGEIRLAEDCRQILEICRSSMRVYILNSNQLEDEKAQLRFFEAGGKIVRYSFHESATLAFTGRELMRTELISFFGDADGEEQAYSLVTGIARLKRMGSLSRQRFLSELKICGCEDDLALLIADGLQGNADFCSVLAFDRSAGQEILTGKLVTLRFAGGSLIVTPGERDMDSVCFARLNHEKLLAAMDDLLGQRKEVELV